jgi:transcriptional regulator with XRE-family HTH domain
MSRSTPRHASVGAENDELRNLHGIGQMLISMRIAMNLSQRELAEKLAVHESQVSRDERSEYYSIAIERAARIQGVLGAHSSPAGLKGSVGRIDAHRLSRDDLPSFRLRATIQILGERFPITLKRIDVLLPCLAGFLNKWVNVHGQSSDSSSGVQITGGR